MRTYECDCDFCGQHFYFTDVDLVFYGCVPLVEPGQPTVECPHCGEANYIWFD